MSKLNKLFLLLSLSFIFTNYVGAQTVNTSSQNVRERILERTQERIQVQNATNTTSTPVRLRNLEELRQQMQAKIQQIKDENKKRIAQNLVSQMERINKRLSEDDLKYLNTIEKVLNKIEERIKNSTTTDATITSKINELKTKIATLRSKIEAQTQKEYLVQIQTETKLRETYQTTKKELMSDHKSLRQELQDLKKEIRDLFLKLKPTKPVKPATTTNATSSN
jgi:DNA repair exonuclease SbcCD ATPase subunit